MPRFVALLLVLLLPLQFSWAVICGYCEQETKALAAQPFGHHTHAQEADAQQPAAQDEASTTGKPAAEADCGACHAAGPSLLGPQAGVQALPAHAARLVPTAAPPRASAHGRLPERPQWNRLV